MAETVQAKAWDREAPVLSIEASMRAMRIIQGRGEAKRDKTTDSNYEKRSSESRRISMVNCWKQGPSDSGIFLI